MMLGWGGGWATPAAPSMTRTASRARDAADSRHGTKLPAGLGVGRRPCQREVDERTGSQLVAEKALKDLLREDDRVQRHGVGKAKRL